MVLSDAKWLWLWYQVLARGALLGAAGLGRHGPWVGGSLQNSFARPVVQKDAEVRCKWWARVDRAETEVVVVGWHHGHHPQGALEAVVACCVPDPCGVASNPMDVKKQTLPSTGLSRATISISGISCPSCPALVANPDVRGTSLLYHVSMPHSTLLDF